MFADDIVIFSQSRKQVEQRARRDGGMLWRGKEWKSVEARDFVNKREIGTIEEIQDVEIYW